MANDRELATIPIIRAAKVSKRCKADIIKYNGINNAMEGTIRNDTINASRSPLPGNRCLLRP